MHHNVRRAGQAIKAAREARGLSREQVCAAAGICIATMYRIERGGVCGVDVAAAVCAAVGLSAAVFDLGLPLADGAEG